MFPKKLKLIAPTIVKLLAPVEVAYTQYAEGAIIAIEKHDAIALVRAGKAESHAGPAQNWYEKVPSGEAPVVPAPAVAKAEEPATQEAKPAEEENGDEAPATHRVTRARSN